MSIFIITKINTSISLQSNTERNPQDEMRAAENAGTFVYIPPKPLQEEKDGEDSEFVDAPLQPGNYIEIKNLIAIYSL